MDARTRMRALLDGEATDRLLAQPLVMQSAARHAGIGNDDYITDGRAGGGAAGHG